MSRRKVIKFYDHVWRVSYCVIFGGTKQQAYEHCCKLNGETPSDSFIGSRADASTFYNEGRKTVVFWFASNKPGLGLIAHEAVHAAVFVLSTSGMKIELEYDEALAYYVQYLCEKITG